MTTAVITVVAGRHEHLRRQRAGLARCLPAPDLHVVIDIDDPEVADVLAATPGLPTRHLTQPTHPAGLPVAAARNAGARAALDTGADTLVFLDVDCIPSPSLLGALRTAARVDAAALICAPVTYLAAEADPAVDLSAYRRPHPARPDPPVGEVVAMDPSLFWSLAFAVSAARWTVIGGFHEGYVGYGGEDTDLAATAGETVADGAAVVMLGTEGAYHQFHPVSDPPVQHLDDILRNSEIFLRRRHRLPMAGWLTAFAERGLLEPAATDDAGRALTRRRRDAVRVASFPPRHEYVDAITPGTVRRVAVQRVTGWEPDPWWRPDALREASADLDVLHVHFGYDHLQPDELAEWLRTVRAAGLGLVVTVHDLRNPHHGRPERHAALLRQLVTAADRVLTLTTGAALECEARFGRRPDVVAHPTLVGVDELPSVTGRDGSHAAGVDGPQVLIPLKALRRNVVDPMAIVAETAAAARATGAGVRVLVEPRALERAELRGLSSLPVRLDVAPHLPHDELCRRVAAAHACVLPYRFGTHSGWLELCRDLGVRVVAPDCGHYAEQGDGVLSYGNDEMRGLDAASLRRAVTQALADARPAPASRRDREAQRDLVRAWHDAAYRGLRRR